MPKSNEGDEDMPGHHRSRAMTRFQIMSTLPDGRHAKPQPPPPAAMLEAKRAQERAAQNPLAYAFGDPLPGRSALDKMKKESRDVG